MPLVWRYLLRKYFQIFALCMFTAIGILFVMRLEDIARFASTGASKSIIALFSLYQLPFIVPFAIPVSSLIASMLLFQRLSSSHELTAFRSFGLSIYRISFPVLAASVFLSLINLTISSEIAPKCRALSKNLSFEVTAANPLYLLQKDSLVKLKNLYIDMNLLKSGKYAKDLLFVMRNHSHERLGLVLAKELSLNKDDIVGKDLTFISNIDSKKEDAFDHLLIENQEEMSTKSSDLCQFLRHSDFSAGEDYQTMKTLLAKQIAEKTGKQKSLYKTYQEIAKRLTLALATFTFTLIGIACAIQIGRIQGHRAIYLALGLSTFFLASFVAGKSMKHMPLMSTVFFLSAHPLILLICFYRMRQVAKGTE